ncbi:hypothetical protein D8B26_002397 [Coccidioides posadasii str. Silveira]|uniref:uncharacterized protein n=1 Tax=Coccidioides posadasii (strain RMSCC 757 / Silveira) TaxID=443226 RepID=UPI001BEDE5B1|nr:hypothetical protein D8B26_002397 [Coccidioides posadasii str. Silveira]
MLYDADKLSLLEAYNQLKCENNMYKAINYKSGLAYEANVEPGDYLADRIRSDKVENFTEKRRIGNKEQMIRVFNDVATFLELHECRGQNEKRQRQTIIDIGTQIINDTMKAIESGNISPFQDEDEDGLAFKTQRLEDLKGDFWSEEQNGSSLA